MAVSTSALIPRVRGFLNEDPFATQGSAADASSVVAVTDGTDFEEGAVLEFQDNGEQAKVISVAGNNLTCFRGWNGTTAAAHAASTTILRDFSYSYAQINQALTTAVNRLWPYAWKTEADTLTVVAGTTWYDLTATQMGIIEANQITGSSPSEKVQRFGVGSLPFEFRRRMPTTVVASGVGIQFPGGLYSGTADINITSAARITGTSDIEDSQTLPVADAVVIGALAAMMRQGAVGGVAQPYTEERAADPLSTFGTLEQEFRTKLEMLKILHEELYPIIRPWG